MKIYFYPHKYLRDRQLDTIKRWPITQVINPQIALNRQGDQVSSIHAKAPKLNLTWKQKLPLLNVKLRPNDASNEAVIYVWGAILATGKFIVDLDNPWSLVGYNLKAMPIYRIFLRHILCSSRCIEIRCMSDACRQSLKLLFGEDVYNKASVHYPFVPQVVNKISLRTTGECRFLFIGTQFEIKGGVALINAFKHIYAKSKNAKLDVITHLPDQYIQLVSSCPGIQVHEAKFTRSEIHEKFMQFSDVLVLPTYIESFGMAALEALAHGLALITTDVYALREMVEDGINGRLLSPPISCWDNYLPSSLYFNLENAKKYIRSTDTSKFEISLVGAMEHFVDDPDSLFRAREASVRIMTERFSC
jgi:glycosyltransferase involved in cell wall biosynthesis